MAHWILMHEHPFTVMEEEGFNMMQKRGMLKWEKIPRNTIKKYCIQVYEAEKKKLKESLKTVEKKKQNVFLVLFIYLLLIVALK